MKRLLAATLLLSATACAPDQAEPAKAAPAPEASGWAAPPRIERVQAVTGGLLFTGRAEPGARVALRDPSGAAFAATADDQGRFDVRTAAPRSDLMLTPQVQLGQEATSAPERLLVLAGGQGPVALLSPGAPTRRLDRPHLLGAVDSDGRRLLLSGVAQAGQRVEISVGGQTLSVGANDQGAWRAMATDRGATTISVTGRTFAYPGRLGGEGAARAGEGWSVGWAAPDGARLWTWLPN